MDKKRVKTGLKVVEFDLKPFRWLKDHTNPLLEPDRITIEDNRTFQFDSSKLVIVTDGNTKEELKYRSPKKLKEYNDPNVSSIKQYLKINIKKKGPVYLYLNEEGKVEYFQMKKETVFFVEGIGCFYVRPNKIITLLGQIIFRF